MNPDELRAPDTDEEPYPTFGQQEVPSVNGRIEVIYTVALLAGLTLAAIAWRIFRG